MFLLIDNNVTEVVLVPFLISYKLCLACVYCTLGDVKIIIYVECHILC